MKKLDSRSAGVLAASSWLRSRLAPGLRYPAALVIAVAILLFPWVVSIPYFIHIAILAGMYLALALSYDITVGQVGAFSLAHPAFFGIGAYTGALLTVNVHAPALVTFALGAVMGGILAVLIGIPSFKLGGHSFAIGTLGFGLTVELIARNWIDVTRGPMGIPGIPKPAVGIPGLFAWHLDRLIDFYYFMLILVALTIVFYLLLVTSRVGRAFRAVREDEILANSTGMDPNGYKLLGFVLGAAIAGVLGVFYAFWFSLVSPDVIGLSETTILLIIVFLGGRGSLRGIIVAALLFTAIPEFLRLAPELRLVLYGLVLLLAIVFFPEGIEGLFQRVSGKK